jgi:hypothetical protein
VVAVFRVEHVEGFPQLPAHPFATLMQSQCSEGFAKRCGDCDLVKGNGERHSNPLKKYPEKIQISTYLISSVYH